MKNRSKHLFLIGVSALFACFNPCFAQLGGQATYAFLRLPQSARVAALGGAMLSFSDDDAALALSNPACLNKTMHQQLSFNSGFIAPEVFTGYASYAHSLPSRWTLHGGVQYLNYGKMPMTDEYGNVQSTFNASEYALTTGIGRKLNKNYSIGVNAHFVTSQLESYQSTALLADAALMYNDTSKGFSAAICINNAGGQLTNYRTGNAEKMPTNLQIGIAQRLKRLPLRLTLTAQHLERWSNRYDDPYAVKETTIFGTEQKNDTSFYWLDNAARHFVFGGEFLLGKKENFRIRVGYNHLTQSELLPKNLRGFLGLSFGVGLKIKQFRIEYAHQMRHFAGGTDYISISTNLSEFKK
ncbi:MAG: hypothetical protein RI894_2147 [Bacteroidota bacterium]|jgi:hypothetical protein